MDHGSMSVTVAGWVKELYFIGQQLTIPASSFQV